MSTTAPLERDSEAGAKPRGPVFVTTQWSVVLAASLDDTTEARVAVEKLCQVYWYPVYHFIRRQGHSTPDAEDLTQEFFKRLLEKKWVAHADQSRGRFRSFLLMVLKRFMAAEWHRANAQKRVGDRHCLPLPLHTAETRYLREVADTNTPEQAFEKQWALTLLESVLGRLRSEYEHDSKGRLFEALKPCLAGSRESQPYSILAATLEMSEGAVKVAVHRLRERYREQLKAEIARTVTSPADVDTEMRHLFRVLSRG
jgi:RNA polymerase sigma-70 factor (ECF subfamily)